MRLIVPVLRADFVADRRDHSGDSTEVLFNSPAFVIFLPVMLAIYWRLHGHGRRIALLAGSYFFYAWWDWRFTSLLIFSTLVDFGCAKAIERRTIKASRKRFLALSIVANLGILATFKYFNFFRDSLDVVLESIGVAANLPALNVLLPMGISFYTFQTMSYTIDVYRGARPERNLLNFAVFVSCFPQLVAGPIMRAKDLLPQIARDRTPTDVDISAGVYRIFRGLFKKMIIAEALAVYVDMVFAAPAGYPGISTWIAVYAYAFQIYMDFSGYTDVAIGCGHLLGLRLTENFNQPYLATSPSDFWRRWHITLSTWLRDYLYIPLGGSRLGRLLTIRNLFITMALGGLWHGAAWTFIAWGVYHACLLTGQRVFRRHATNESQAELPFAVRAVRIILMFHATCLGWVLFRAQDWATALSILANLVDFSSHQVHGLRIAAIVALCAIAHTIPALKSLGDRFARLPALGQGAVAALCMWSLLLLSPDANAFIYFRF